MSGVKDLARAKINLFLHVAAPDARGYHPLQSLVVFADVGDVVEFLPKKATASAEDSKLTLRIDGRFAADLSAGEDNLILKAVRRFESLTGLAADRHDINLTKILPVASGLGGGSADAGAVLRQLRGFYCPDLEDSTLEAAARMVGADGVMCLWNQSSIAEGYGENLTPLPLPSVPAVLINPGVACPTSAVYDGFDALGAVTEIAAQQKFDAINDIDQLVAALKTTRNDLQKPAIQLQPVIAEVLKDLEAQSETLLARMSGSGATCFALCADGQAAKTLAGRLQGLWPAAWVCACRLG